MGVRGALLISSIALVAALPARAAAAGAPATLSHVASELRADGVYADPGNVQDFSPLQQQIVRDLITSAGQPVFLAVLEAHGRGDVKVVERRLVVPPASCVSVA